MPVNNITDMLLTESVAPTTSNPVVQEQTRDSLISTINNALHPTMQEPPVVATTSPPLEAAVAAAHNPLQVTTDNMPLEVIILNLVSDTLLQKVSL